MMYRIIFYSDKNGKSEIREYIKDLTSRNDKDSRIKSDKINDYIQAVAVYGKRAGMPYIKHLEGDIWEIRPLRDRILFAAWVNNSFILLHHFTKQTQKTPEREIEQAKRNLRDYIDRSK